MWLWFAGLALLPIAKAVALHFTIPLMVVPLAIILLRERPGLARLICTLIGFGGVLVILRPGAVPIDFSVLLVLGSALSYAGVSIYTRVFRRDRKSQNHDISLSCPAIDFCPFVDGRWLAHRDARSRRWAIAG